MRSMANKTPYLLFFLFLAGTSLYAQSGDSVVTLAQNVSTKAQTVANLLGIVVIIIGIIGAAMRRSIAIFFGALILGGALAVAPALYSTAQSWF